MICDELRSLILQAADVAVAKYAERLSPTVTEISQRKLYKEFGRAWVDKKIATGRKEFASHRRGNRKMYNRSSFAAQWVDEQCPPEITGKYADPRNIG